MNLWLTLGIIAFFCLIVLGWIIGGAVKSERKNEDIYRETWNQGIWIIWFDPDGIVDAELEICKIEDGKAIFRGKVFETTVDLYGNKL